VTVKTQSVALETQLSLREVASLVNTAFASMKARVEAIEPSSNPLDNLDGVADVAVVGQRAAFMNVWAVQVYVYDLGGRTGVELVALGEGAFSRAWHGLRNSTSLSASVKRMDVLVQKLRAGDPQVQLIA
jgi:hypothetical protein